MKFIKGREELFETTLESNVAKQIADDLNKEGKFKKWGVFKENEGWPYLDSKVGNILVHYFTHSEEEDTDTLRLFLNRGMIKFFASLNIDEEMLLSVESVNTNGKWSTYFEMHSKFLDLRLSIKYYIHKVDVTIHDRKASGNHKDMLAYINRSFVEIEVEKIKMEMSDGNLKNVSRLKKLIPKKEYDKIEHLGRAGNYGMFK